MNIKYILLLALWLLITSESYAMRYALVIGNSNYGSSIGTLKNPKNDAMDMSALLMKKDFKVTTLINSSLREMKQGITTFTKQLHEKNAVGLFFFAGHGVEVDGRNFLIPLGATINGESDVEYEAVDVGRVMSEMEYAGNNLNMIILDACRNNPFARSFRSSRRGLAKTDPPKGSLILYATSPGDVASDGPGRNGLFTQHLLKAIDTPNVTVEKVFKTTANKVYKATNKKQLPWQSGVMLGDFYFTINAPNAKKLVITQSAAQSNAAEIAFWESIKNESNPDFFISYLNQYPNGMYSEVARLKIEHEDSTLANEQSYQATPGKVRLTVNTSPENARVKILNIVPRYYDGIELNPGPYHIAVSHVGYERYVEWITLSSENKISNIVLKKANKELNTSGKVGSYQKARNRSKLKVGRWNIAKVKAAYRAKRLSKIEYKNIIRNLKVRYNSKIKKLKIDYRNKKITKAQYNKSVNNVKKAYTGS